MEDNTAEQLFQCPICLEDMTSREPHALSCLHSFCYQCLKKLHLTDQTESLECPTCRAQTQIPNGKITNLPVNFPMVEYSKFIKELEEKYKNIITNMQNQPKCDFCRVNGTCTPAEMFCRNCKQHICAKCVDKYHNKYSLFSSHHVEHVDSYKQNKFCNAHDMPYTLYCIRCEKKLCSYCFISGQHNKHLDTITGYTGDDVVDLSTEVSKKIKHATNVNAMFRIQAFINTDVTKLIEHLKKSETATFRNSFNRDLGKALSKLRKDYFKMRQSFYKDINVANKHYYSEKGELYWKLLSLEKDSFNLEIDVDAECSRCINTFGKKNGYQPLVERFTDTTQEQVLLFNEIMKAGEDLALKCDAFSDRLYDELDHLIRNQAVELIGNIPKRAFRIISPLQVRNQCTPTNDVPNEGARRNDEQFQVGTGVDAQYQRLPRNNPQNQVEDKNWPLYIIILIILAYYIFKGYYANEA